MQLTVFFKIPDENLIGNVIQGQQYDLVVGILSARSNFYLRESLRKTWVGHAQKHSLLKERYICIFIVGFLLQEISSVNFMHFRLDPRRCKNVTKGPLARIEPASLKFWCSAQTSRAIESSCQA